MGRGEGPFKQTEQVSTTTARKGAGRIVYTGMPWPVRCPTTTVGERGDTYLRHDLLGNDGCLNNDASAAAENG